MLNSSQPLCHKTYDLAIVGSGILGLAHAYLAARKGLKVIVVERDGAPHGASVRNFGFVTVTGQQDGDFYRLAKRSRRLWQDAIDEMGLTTDHQGLYMCVRFPESEAVLGAFMKTDMAEGCQILNPSDVPLPLSDKVTKVLHSQHEVRLNSRTAIPKIVEALTSNYGVEFSFFCTALGLTGDTLHTNQGTITATQFVVCQGDNLSGLFSERLPDFGVSRCKLQMLRLDNPGFVLPGSIMSDLGLIRYLGYSELPEAATLKQRLCQDYHAHINAGVHLIVVQNQDGSLVVGDSHVYGESLDPFSDDRIDDLILDEYAHILGHPPKILERWIGTYATSDQQLYFIDKPDDHIRHIVVTCGAGATTSFAIAEQSLISLGILS
jgi:FAD dependent oxidoreductase TIGR03364